MKVSEHAQLGSLASAVVLQALADFRSDNDPVRAVDANLFLVSKDAGIWFEVAGIPFADPRMLLVPERHVLRRVEKFETYEKGE